MEFYTYIWRDADGVPFYIGKGKGNRAHDIGHRSSEFKKIHRAGGCTVEIDDWFIHESQAHAREVELIALYGRRDMGGLLVNKTDGGEGVSGWVPSEETRAKISASKVGRKLTEEHRAKIAMAGIGRINKPESIEKTAAAHRGLTRSDGTKAKISAAAKGRKLLEETRAKISLAGIGRKHSAESVERRAAKHRGSTRSLEARQRMSEAKIGFTPSPAANAKNSEKKRLKGPTSGQFKGVFFDNARGKWIAVLKNKGKAKHLGRFELPENAARAYDNAAFEAWGLGCYFNFPDEIKEMDEA